MSLGTPLAVLLAVVFLIPGFIWKKGMQATSKYVQKGSISLLECLMLSCLNYLIASPVIWLLLLSWPKGLVVGDGAGLSEHPWYLAAWLALVFVLPILLTLVTNLLVDRVKIRQVLGRIGVSISHPAPTGWDYAFAREEEYWARIELTDGEFVEGLFGSESLASGEKGERDVFLQEVFEYNGDSEQYESVQRNAGVWIGKERIKKISFFRVRSDAITEAMSYDRQVHDGSQEEPNAD